jgi:hypothetical protein
MANLCGEIIEELKVELAKPEIPTKIFGPNLEEILNAAGFYRRDVSTKQKNIDTSGQCAHKSDKSVHEPVAYWNGVDMFTRADEVEYTPNWSDYYPEPLYAAPRKEWDRNVLEAALEALTNPSTTMTIHAIQLIKEALNDETP